MIWSEFVFFNAKSERSGKLSGMVFESVHLDKIWTESKRMKSTASNRLIQTEKKLRFLEPRKRTCRFSIYKLTATSHREVHGKNTIRLED